MFRGVLFLSVFYAQVFNDSDSLLIVQETLGILLQDEAQFAQDFYCRLFNRAPDVEQLFQANLEAQGKMLTQMLKGVLYALSRPQHLARGLEQLGRQHVIYGVNTAYYAVFQEALLATIEDRLDGAYTPEVARAWEATINTILGLMQRGGETAPPGAPEESSLPNVESPLW